MTTKTPHLNLIPVEHITARRHSRALSRWTLICVVCGSLCSLPIIAVLLLPKGMGKRALIQKTRENSGRISEAQQAGTELKQEMALLSMKIESASMIDRRIRWSGIFSGLAIAADDHVWIEHLRCSAESEQGDDRVEIKLQGYAPSQGAARTFVVDLERLGLFDEVTLTGSTRTTSGENTQVQFQITIVLDPVLAAKGGGS